MWKVCNTCGKTWYSLNSFLSDSGISLVGYQVDFEELTLGLFLFNHTCETTLAIYAKELTDLYSGPVFIERATGSNDCLGYCLEKTSLSYCPAQCECAYIREIIQIVKEYPMQ